MTTQRDLDLLPEPTIFTQVRWQAQRDSKGKIKKVNPTGPTQSCDESAFLATVGKVEDFTQIFESLRERGLLRPPTNGRRERDEVFRDLLRLRGRGLVVDYGPDLWRLDGQG